MHGVRILHGLHQSSLKRGAHTLPEYVGIRLRCRRRGHPFRGQTGSPAKHRPCCDRGYLFRTRCRRIPTTGLRRQCCPTYPYPATQNLPGSPGLKRHARRTPQSQHDIYSADHNRQRFQCEWCASYYAEFTSRCLRVGHPRLCRCHKINA